MKSKIQCPLSISRTCLAQEFGLVFSHLALMQLFGTEGVLQHSTRHLFSSQVSCKGHLLPLGPSSRVVVWWKIFQPNLPEPLFQSSASTLTNLQKDLHLHGRWISLQYFLHHRHTFFPDFWYFAHKFSVKIMKICDQFVTKIDHVF